jgi:hypothetical protein
VIGLSSAEVEELAVIQPYSMRIQDARYARNIAEQRFAADRLQRQLTPGVMRSRPSRNCRS